MASSAIDSFLDENDETVIEDCDILERQLTSNAIQSFLLEEEDENIDEKCNELEQQLSGSVKLPDASTDDISSRVMRQVSPTVACSSRTASHQCTLPSIPSTSGIINTSIIGTEDFPFDCRETSDPSLRTITAEQCLETTISPKKRKHLVDGTTHEREDIVTRYMRKCDAKYGYNRTGVCPLSYLLLRIFTIAFSELLYALIST